MANQGPIGLEATGGPRGASQPLQSIKIENKNRLEVKYTHQKTPRGARISGPVLKWFCWVYLTSSPVFVNFDGLEWL